MEARTTRSAVPAAASRFVLLAALLMVSMGAQQRSANFIVETPDPNFAQQVAQAAEKYRHDLAIEWLGKPMPNWSRPCALQVQVGGGAGGATTFVFDRGEVFNWNMSIQGSRERILDSVLPHEITHMVFASHFRQPLPRWADEGGATSIEHASEKNKHHGMLDQFLRTGRGIAFNQMFTMTEYPADIMPLYAQGYSLAEFLIQTGGRRKYIEFLGDGLQSDDWPGAVQRNYGIADLGALQNTWLAWVQQGWPTIQPRQAQPAGGILLAAQERRPRPEPNLIHYIRDKQTPAAPLAGLVPVHLNSAGPQAGAGPKSLSPRPLGEGPGVRAVAATTSPRAPSTAIKWVDPTPPRPSAGETLASGLASASPAKVLTASGWYVPGEPVPTVDPVPVQASHPQPLEQPRQTILR